MKPWYRGTNYFSFLFNPPDDTTISERQSLGQLSPPILDSARNSLEQADKKVGIKVIPVR